MYTTESALPGKPDIDVVVKVGDKGTGWLFGSRVKVDKDYWDEEVGALGDTTIWRHIESDTELEEAEDKVIKYRLDGDDCDIGILMIFDLSDCCVLYISCYLSAYIVTVFNSLFLAALQSLSLLIIS